MKYTGLDQLCELDARSHTLWRAIQALFVLECRATAAGAVGPGASGLLVHCEGVRAARDDGVQGLLAGWEEDAPQTALLP